jgi:hypothetical protein
MTTSATVLGRRLGALIFAVLFLGALPGAASAIELPEKPGPDEPPRGAVLTGQAALDVARSVCYFLELDAKALWEPGPAEIARLEKLLPEFMAGQRTPEDYQPLHEYYRQYVGIVQDGKKRICVNFFHHYFVRENLERPHLNHMIQKTLQEGGRAEDFWKREPMVVDDGGAYFFTVQFDPETGTFSQLRFNGYA